MKPTTAADAIQATPGDLKDDVCEAQSHVKRAQALPLSSETPYINASLSTLRGENVIGGAGVSVVRDKVRNGIIWFEMRRHGEADSFWVKYKSGTDTGTAIEQYNFKKQFIKGDVRESRAIPDANPEFDSPGTSISPDSFIRPSCNVVLGRSPKDSSTDSISDHGAQIDIEDVKNLLDEVSDVSNTDIEKIEVEEDDQIHDLASSSSGTEGKRKRAETDEESVSKSNKRASLRIDMKAKVLAGNVQALSSKRKQPDVTYQKPRRKPNPAKKTATLKTTDEGLMNNYSLFHYIQFF